MKKYEAGSVISVSVVMPNGNTKHIRFDSISNGKSIYLTNDPAIMKAIEGSRRFQDGDIVLVEDTEYVAPKKVKKDIPVVNDEYKEIKVASWDDAKAYLVEELGIPANKVRTQSAISTAAQANKVKFIF